MPGVNVKAILDKILIDAINNSMDALKKMTEEYFLVIQSFNEAEVKDVYPHMKDVMEGVLNQSKPAETVIFNRANKIIDFIFVDVEKLDTNTPTSKKRSAITGQVEIRPSSFNFGWWRFFENGVKGGMSWGSDSYFFAPGRNFHSGGGGFMRKIEGAKLKTGKPHPGVQRIGFLKGPYYSVWLTEYRKRIRDIIQKQFNLELGKIENARKLAGV